MMADVGLVFMLLVIVNSDKWNSGFCEKNHYRLNFKVHQSALVLNDGTIFGLLPLIIKPQISTKLLNFVAL